MIAIDKEALICDMAETYRIFDMRMLPLRTIATLASGLREDSRIKRKMRGVKTSDTNVLIGIIADRLGQLVNGLAGSKEEQKLITELFFDEQIKKDKDIKTYSSKEDFDREREKILRKEG